MKYLKKTCSGYILKLWWKELLYLKISSTRDKLLKKLVFVFVIYTFVIIVSKEDIILNYVFCIYYLFYFQKKIYSIKALLDFDSRVNISLSTYTSKLSLKVL